MSSELKLMEEIAFSFHLNKTEGNNLEFFYHRTLVSKEVIE